MAGGIISERDPTIRCERDRFYNICIGGFRDRRQRPRRAKSAATGDGQIFRPAPVGRLSARCEPRSGPQRHGVVVCGMTALGRCALNLADNASSCRQPRERLRALAFRSARRFFRLASAGEAWIGPNRLRLKRFTKNRAMSPENEVTTSLTTSSTMGPGYVNCCWQASRGTRSACQRLPQSE